MGFYITTMCFVLNQDNGLLSSFSVSVVGSDMDS